ncbi:BA14K family protein [Bradyrhizobium elkanii]|uniref:BA14K family protein n=1 Tax=Bradyrhizobium elkanii TaxID=29448 RepID=UPI00209D8577|nr:BA14K family protein [Bradyrhizobium elkanii]MCS3518889.1 F0F1-type ATP synthase membrane subunit c/vacuolar-type H+-ATPase subunit K [Bradyrhizobium elkanii]MCS4075447.1 F0F1-type ATP synthase membrane subunit c/vacuolar-type H+-ATPase subunit K [Bradyrhizobium elkanii]MCS4082080.1 F0F1-type ATP synthase membrane subunit c/vacuolar-type H+-ATPase subunit K [Bradyrhizobium elkanii]MCW2128341.1 F0F1-type ATP synthase membrane subunit c/vacuolar-type H+-ATPase subunit K [Bradyrhizobium elkanii
MRRARVVKVVLMAATGAMVFSAPAISAPLQHSAGVAAAAPSLTEKVWCRYGQCYYNGGGAAVGGLVGGLIGGVIAAGAANAAAQQEAAAAQQHAASCAQRYRSYDAASNTFQAKDGRRYPCQ